MSAYFLDQFDHLTASERLPAFLKQELSRDQTNGASGLAKACGYTRPNVVSMWLSGATAIPLKAIPKIAVFLGHDIANVLPLWIASQAGGEDQDVLWNAAKRMLSAWEFGLVHTARDIYLGDEDDDVEDDGSQP